MNRIRYIVTYTYRNKVASEIFDNKDQALYFYYGVFTRALSFYSQVMRMDKSGRIFWVDYENFI